MESAFTPERRLEQACEEAFRTMQRIGVAEFTEIKEGVSKVDFLKWLVDKKGVLLHGSNVQEIAVLEPRLANCTSKEFGNMKAVYAIADPVLPTFYAIKDSDRFRGTARSGTFKIVEDGREAIKYDFAVSKELLEKAPWSDGAVYVLPRDTFVQGHDDEGDLIDEWASEVPVIPMGKIEIKPDDFPFLHEIVSIEDQ